MGVAFQNGPADGGGLHGGEQGAQRGEDFGGSAALVARYKKTLLSARLGLEKCTVRLAKLGSAGCQKAAGVSGGSKKCFFVWLKG